MKTIVAAIDFSDATPQVLAAAKAQSKAFGVDLHIVHVQEAEPAYTAYGFTPDEFPAMHTLHEEAGKRAQKRLDEEASKIPGASTALLDGSPLNALTTYVQKVDADLLVLGSHGHNVVARLLLGSVAEGMVRKAMIPTLIIPVAKD